MLRRADRDWLLERARAVGFDAAGLTAVPETPSAESPDSFAAWIAAGYSGEMDYLARRDADGELLRSDLRRSLPWARSVLVCAASYNSPAPSSLAPAPPGHGWIARYACSGDSAPQADPNAIPPASDYHHVLLDRLGRVAAELTQRWPHAQTRCYVDTGPLLERDFAARAGLGWIGRNTCLIHQQLGSWLLLGVVVTSLELQPEAASLPAADRCGSCTRCIDACPTDALLLPTPDQPHRHMDASRCIAYLTIEHKGAIPDELRPGLGRHVFGCDICQDVCPWNRRAPVPAQPLLPPRPQLVNPDLDWLASLDGPAFNRWFRGSPLERTRRRRILRNVALAMGNSGQPRFHARLHQWAQEPEPVLAEAARWALAGLDRTVD